MHSDRHGHGQKSMLSTGASENNGARFLRASSKSRGCFGTFVLSSLDTFVSTTIIFYIYKFYTILIHIFILFYPSFLFSSSL